MICGMEDNRDNLYCIHSPSEHGFWSNENGWVMSIADATYFGHSEVIEMGMPNVRTKGNDAVWMIVAYGD